MNSTREIHISEVVRQQFVGRSAELDIFYQRFAYRHMKNGVYYCGAGGLGKTWILEKILLDNQDDPTRIVTDIIDFFDTKNHNVRGLQATIKSRLPNPEVFQPYDKAIKGLEVARSKNKHPGAIANLEARADKIFVECCQQAVVGQEVVLLFDTFERVQQRRVGQWLLHKFLPNVRSLVVAIVGRPTPAPAEMPDNVVPYELPGLDFEAFIELIRRHLQSAPDDVIEIIHKYTGGSPLIANLILDLPEGEREQFISQMSQLEKDERVQDSPELQSWLIGQFAHPPHKRNRVIWAMAYLRRRFDVPMLRYIVENLDKWFRPADYDAIFEELAHLVYVKKYPYQQSHLLHDEIQQMVAEYALPEIGIWEEFCADFYNLVVKQYYPETIKAIEEAPPNKRSLADLDLARQLRAEQLGYIFDDDPGVGFERYEAYRRDIESTHKYDFEELLWGEVRDRLDSLKDSYQICDSRGQWLRKHSLFQKAEQHYRQMVTRFQEQPIPIRQNLGFMLLRQGRFLEAERVFQESRSLVEGDDFRNIAMVENTLGQVATRAGQWNQALKHYNQSFRAAARIRDPHMVSAYLNRGELYALQGNYEQAKRQCKQAIKLLESLPETERNIRRNIYVHRNLGSAYRYSGDYAQAAEQYRISLKLARENDDLEAACNVLQHTGINEHYWGRTFRRDLLSQTLLPGLPGVFLPKIQNALDNACEYQLRAWQNLTQSLEMAREANWRDMIDDGLHRLAKVYREVYRIQELLPKLTDDVDVPDALVELQSKGKAYPIPLEHEYAHELLTSGRFEQLDWVEKSIRLFDLSAIVADEVNDIRRVLDGSTELARMFIELRMKEQVPLVLRRIERLQGYDYQEELFTAMNEITRADLDFMEQRFDSALERYTRAYANVAEQTGYASFLLTDRLRDLEWRLRHLPSEEIALQWCDFLESEWQNRLPPEKWPDMLSVPERIRAEIWARRAGHEGDSGNTGEANYE